MEPIRVLLADDSAHFLEAAAQFLEAERRVVVGQANSVADAIEKIESLQPDVVLMEVAMAKGPPNRLAD